MEKIIETYNYGFSIFSCDVMTEFLKSEKIRSKKVLALLQKDKDTYLKTIEGGIWMPIPSIDAGKYVISFEGFDDSFDDSWGIVLTQQGFNIEVKNGLWFTDIGNFLAFKSEEYFGDGTEVDEAYGQTFYYSCKEQYYKEANDKRTYCGFHYDVPDGKYTVTIKGYARKEITDDKAANNGFQISLNKVDEFKEAKNPREDDYEFNIGWINSTKEAIVKWLPENLCGVNWPLTAKEYKSAITIPLENEKYGCLTIVFDLNNQIDEGLTRCRAKRGFGCPKDFVLESGQEYPIFEQIYKRGKYSYKELGSITIE